MEYMTVIHKLTGRQMTIVEVIRDFEVLYIAPSILNDYTVKVYTEDEFEKYFKKVG